jgi:hypothetical protein
MFESNQTYEDGQFVLFKDAFKRLMKEKNLFTEVSQKIFLEKEGGAGKIQNEDELIRSWDGIKFDLVKSINDLGLGYEYEAVVHKIDSHVRVYDPIYKDKIWILYKIVEREIDSKAVSSGLLQGLLEIKIF